MRTDRESIETPTWRRPDWTSSGVMGSAGLTLATSKAGVWPHAAHASAAAAQNRVDICALLNYDADSGWKCPVCRGGATGERFFALAKTQRRKEELFYLSFFFFPLRLGVF